MDSLPQKRGEALGTQTCCLSAESSAGFLDLDGRRDSSEQAQRSGMLVPNFLGALPCNWRELSRRSATKLTSGFPALSVVLAATEASLKDSRANTVAGQGKGKGLREGSRKTSGLGQSDFLRRVWRLEHDHRSLGQAS